MFVRDIPERK